MKINIASLFVSLVLVASVPVFAQEGTGVVSAAAPDPAVIKAVQDMMEASNYRTQMSAVMQQLSKNLSQSMRNGAEISIENNLKFSAADKQKALAGLDIKLAPKIQLALGFMNDPALLDEILDEMIPVYANLYTVDELEQITAFYRSPVGVKIQAMRLQLMSEGARVSQRVVARRIGPLIQQLQSPAK